jgi:RIO-like serine/threonine protein kinase
VNYHRLLYRGLKVPKPVLYLEEPFFAPLGRSCVVTEEAAGYSHLDRFIEDTGRSGLEAILDPLARNIARIHRLFLSNRDLKAQNILVSPALDILFIDPEGVQPMKEPATYTMARDLMRLNASFQPGGLVTTTDRLRFLKAYLAHLHPISPSVKRLWLEIYHLTLEKWAAWARKRFTG